MRFYHEWYKREINVFGLEVGWHAGGPFLNLSAFKWMLTIGLYVAE